MHEYQADDAVLQCGFDAEQYIMLMVSSVAGARTTLASGFSYSLVRKRLQMLSRGASRRAGLRMLLVVPALAVLLALFSFTGAAGRSRQPGTSSCRTLRPTAFRVRLFRRCGSGRRAGPNGRGGRADTLFQGRYRPVG